MKYIELMLSFIPINLKHDGWIDTTHFVLILLENLIG